MKIIEKKLNIKEHTLPENYNFAFLDIETDGLSHKNKLAIIGLLFITKTNPQGLFIQLFNDDYHSEKEILMSLVKLLKNHEIDYFISFNGDAFDFPFLNARFKHYQLSLSLNKEMNIDLLRIVRRHKKALNIANARLKDVELFLGIQRKDVISGKDSVILYHAYLESKDPRLLETILLHNYDDILNMVPLISIFNHITESINDFLHAFKIIHGVKWYLTEIRIDTNHVNYRFVCHNDSVMMEHHHETIGISFHKKNKIAELKLLLKHYPKVNLTALDVNHLLNTDFSELENDEKQKYVIQYNGINYTENIENIGWDVFSNFIENM